MIIPLGHDQTEVRRLPWVTFTLMGLCVLVHLVLAFAPGMSETEIGQDLTEAVEYWMTHPYLELPPRLQEELLSGFPEEEFAAWRAILKQNAGPPPAETTIAGEQAELDEMVAQGFAGMEELPLRKYGLVPSRASILTLFTHMFLHVGWLHLLGNLFFLYLTGPFIEDVWGRPIFLGFYLLGGLASGGLFAMRYADLDIPLVGASGAIAAVMGAFLIRYWHIKIKFFYWIGFFFRGTFKAPAWLMLPLWMLRELFAATMMDSLDPSGRSGGTAFWAHVWGFLFGVGVALSIRFLKIEQRFVHKAIEAKTTVVNNAVVAEAMEAQDAGRTDEAIASLTSELQRSPGNSEAVLTLWGLAVGASRVAEAVPAMQRLLREEVRAGEFELAMTHRAELSEYALDAKVDPMVDLRLAEFMLEDEQRDQAASLLRNALEQVSPETPPGMLVRLARLACRVDADVGLAALEAALAHPELPEEAREEFEGKKKELAALQPVAAPTQSEEPAGPTIEADGITIPGFEPTSFGEPATEPEEMPAEQPAFVPDVGGDAPLDPVVFDGVPEMPGFETTDPSFPAAVPVMGGDAPAEEVNFPARQEPEVPGFEAAEASWPTEIQITGDNVPAPEPEPLTAGPADPVPAPGPEAIDPSMLAVDPSMGVELTTPDPGESYPETPAVDQAAALGLDLSAALTTDPVAPDFENDSRAADPIPVPPAVSGPPVESAAMESPVEVAASPAPALDAPVAEKPAADGPASLRTAGTIPVPGNSPARPVAPAKILELHQAEPLSIDDTRMTFHVGGRGPSVLGLDKVQAVSTAVIRPPGRPALIVIDLLLDPPWATGARLRVVRMRTGRLDPSKVIPEAPNSAAALRMMIDKLLTVSQGIPLPDTRSVKGKPFREFSSLRQYELEILQAG